MADQQLTFKDDEIIQMLNKVYLNLREGLFQTSIDLLQGALKIEPEYPGLTSALKSAEFWQERQERLDSITDSYQKGEFLINQWKLYTAMATGMGSVPDRCLMSIKQYVFHNALEHYISERLSVSDSECPDVSDSERPDASGSERLSASGSERPDASGSERLSTEDIGERIGKSDKGERRGVHDSDMDPELYLRIGKCYKVIGNYEKAIECLELASQQKKENPEILAELADCYSLVNEVRVSKAFFREAFFINPQDVDISSIESPMMHRLISKIKEFGFPELELAEWIPVYGTILGVFNVKRELRPLELGKLKQSIYSLEKMLEEGNQENQYPVPRLINRYFWLIDHFVSTKEDKHKIEETVLKIKEIDPSIYRQYTD